MENHNTSSGKTTTMTVRLSPDVGERLEALAHGTKRSRAQLAGEAIAAFDECNTWWVSRIRAAPEDARSGRPGVPHDQVVEWIRSWNTGHELPRPEAKRQPYMEIVWRPLYRARRAAGYSRRPSSRSGLAECVLIEAVYPSHSRKMAPHTRSR